MKSFKTYISEAKKAPKDGYDIGDGFSVTKIGMDANGNWSYWITKGASKAKKIQTTNLAGGSGKITDVREFKDAKSKDAKKAIELIKDYASKHMKF